VLARTGEPHLRERRRLRVIVRPGLKPDDEAAGDPQTPQAFVTVDGDALDRVEGLPPSRFDASAISSRVSSVAQT
jgi:hypothetical protein